MPETISYDPATMVLSIGAGRIAPVPPEVWDYDVSGMRVVKRWFDRRKKTPDGRRSSDLDERIADRWPPEWTTELLQVLNVLHLLVQTHEVQVELLDRIVDAPLVSVAELTDAGVLPVGSRPEAEKPSRGALGFF